MSGMKPWTTAPVGVAVGQSGAVTVLAQSFVAASGSADTNENVLATIAIPANTQGLNGALFVQAWFSHPSGSGSVTWRVRYSGASGTILSSQASTSNSDVMVGFINGNKNSASAQFTLLQQNIVATASVSDSSIDTAAATSLVISAQKATAGDTATLKGYTVWVIKP